MPPKRDDVTIGVLSRLSRALDLAARAHAITGAPADLPDRVRGPEQAQPASSACPVAQQAEFDAIAEKIAWTNARVAAFSQYLLRDDPLGGKPGASVNGGTIGFQTGLEYVNGKPKPLYFGWPVPLTVSKTGHGYSLWGLVRPTHRRDEGDGARAARRARASYRTLKTVTTNSLGYWTLHSSTQGGALARALGQPGGRQVRRPADQRSLGRRWPARTGAGAGRRHSCGRAS